MKKLLVTLGSIGILLGMSSAMAADIQPNPKYDPSFQINLDSPKWSVWNVNVADVDGFQTLSGSARFSNKRSAIVCTADFGIRFDGAATVRQAGTSAPLLYDVKIESACPYNGYNMPTGWNVQETDSSQSKSFDDDRILQDLNKCEVNILFDFLNRNLFNRDSNFPNFTSSNINVIGNGSCVEGYLTAW